MLVAFGNVIFVGLAVVRTTILMILSALELLLLLLPTCHIIPHSILGPEHLNLLLRLIKLLCRLG